MKAVMRGIALIGIINAALCLFYAVTLFNTQVDGGGIGFRSVYLNIKRLPNEEIPILATKFLVAAIVSVVVVMAIWFFARRYYKHK